MEAELQRRAEAARNSKKAARSQIVFDIKPWEADTGAWAGDVGAGSAGPR